jgi:hypothetical protein
MLISIIAAVELVTEKRFEKKGQPALLPAIYGLSVKSPFIAGTIIFTHTLKG